MLKLETKIPSWEKVGDDSILPHCFNGDSTPPSKSKSSQYFYCWVSIWCETQASVLLCGKWLSFHFPFLKVFAWWNKNEVFEVSRLGTHSDQWQYGEMQHNYSFFCCQRVKVNIRGFNSVVVVFAGCLCWIILDCQPFCLFDCGGINVVTSPWFYLFTEAVLLCFIVFCLILSFWNYMHVLSHCRYTWPNFPLVLYRSFSSMIESHPSFRSVGPFHFFGNSQEFR